MTDLKFRKHDDEAKLPVDDKCEIVEHELEMMS